MRYYFITGERSGDLHAGNLLKELIIKDPTAEVRAVGGDYLERAGATISYHYSDIAVMGFAEVVFSFRKVMKTFKKVRKDLIRFQPDVVVLVDFGGFNIRMAKFAKAAGIKVYYYITPKIWAWNQKRALKIKCRVDHMFVILPFEKDFYKKFQWEVDYVGNPVVDAVKQHQVNDEFLDKYKIDPGKKIVALLPGSRQQELIKIIPLYKELTSNFKNVQFIVAAVNSLPEGLYQQLKYIHNIAVIYEQTYDILAHSDAAVVTSGTATLETALFDVPQLVIYKTHPLSYLIARQLIKVKFISLVNLIAGKEVVKELIQQQMNPENVSKALDQLLNNQDEINKVKNGYDNVKEILGTENASAKTAELMLRYLKKENAHN